MNITTQTSCLAQSTQLAHNGVLVFNTPSNNIKASMAGQTCQPFKQLPNVAQFAMANVKSIIIRVRLVMHDFCVLSYQVIAFNFGKQITATLEANELYVWKRHNLEASNNA